MTQRITSLDDVLSLFAEHSVVRPLAECWRKALRAWEFYGPSEDVTKARDTCLKAVETALSNVGADTREARERPLLDDVRPKEPVHLEDLDDDTGSLLTHAAATAG